MDNNGINQVSIVDIKMPFWSMVVFMVKAALASIPAVIIVALIFSILSGIFGGIFGGISGGLGQISV